KKRHRAADGTSVFWHRHVNAKKVKSAKWMATGLGVFDLYVNGGLPLGWDFLKPGFTDFAKTKRSFTYDITSCLRTGVGEANDFGAEVSAGWWRDKVNDYAGWKSAFRGVIVLTYADGSTEVFGTKASEWQGRVAGPVLHAGIYDGEEFDARASNMARKPSGRFEPGGCERSEEFRGEILPSEGAEIVLREDLTEKRNMVGRNLVVKPGKAVVVDFGQNCSAVPFFEFRAKRGTVLTALPGEMLNDADKGVHGCDGPKGSVYRANLRIPNDGMRVVYTFAGEGWEKYLPRFTYFGYRYVSITATDDVEIRCVGSLPVTSIAEEMETGRIETGVADLNQFFTNVYWTQLSNFLSVPTDCPQRNERLGWGADAQIYSEAGSYIADTSRLFRKWTRDVRDGRCEDGGYPSAAPRGPWGQETFNFGWADAGVMVPWTVWKMFGDRTILEENYEAMAKFVRKIDETKYDFEDKIDYLWADWLSFETFESCGNAYGNFYGKWKHHPDAKNYRLYLAACHWLNDARLMVRMAEACGRADDAAGFRESASRALAYIRDRFLEPDGLLLKPMCHLQTACVFALKFGIVEGPAKTATLALLTKSIRAHGNVMLTGILGTRYLLDALAECGETELCYTLLLQRGNPSWLHSVGHGATTVWERCNGYTKERGFGPVSMNSYNHYAFGAVIAWVYRTAAGIAADPEKPGFKNIIMAPKPDRRLGYVKAEYKSRAGLIKGAWRYEGPRWICAFTVPAGATATVTLPGASEAKAYSAGSYHIDVPSGTAAVGTTPRCKTAK
ncbi:MAG: family 78 glycoside hydrolase catalytic domain, partial [bacterium]|nr:family 78 glycoside hydrolase catalytic domain [Candidatus Colisoma equi]